MSRIRRLVAVLGAALLLGACGAQDDEFSIGSGSQPTTTATAPTTASSDPATEDYVTQDELDAFKAELDERFTSLEGDIREWVEDGFVSDDELEDLVDVKLSELIDQTGFLTQGDIDKIVAELEAGGAQPERIEEVREALTPTGAPAQGVAGDNPCTNREGGTFVDQMLLDLGRELKMADTLRPDGTYLQHRVSFIDYVESDPVWEEVLVELWNERVENEEWAFTLLEPARARVYWCPGVEADGTTRSGVWRHQVTIPTGKILYDFGNGVWVQKDCHNLTVFIWPPEGPPPPPTTTPTTVPPTTTPPGTTTPPTTVPPTTTPPVTTTPPTTVKPPVTTVAAPATTAAPASSVPAATSPITIADPPEVTDPEPIVTGPAPTAPAPPEPVPCDPRLPRGAPGSCE